ncbi:uncharacterized protein EV420DRAFT_1485137 [Desarmillaria tabescens]|uniref:Uncharacterized protein n=1 Tax=Armillaria tabescens TaxID=1929756 RepID=A0AA39MRE2_ARMTA|nr:uncharacterized protein EV420DRAFT_1485137 [Desarmillaria tabescens]KAK0443030.1 hypothetical protein EV420DRAFT_1485137 [Desarmillaria tabescens]
MSLTHDDALTGPPPCYIYHAEESSSTHHPFVIVIHGNANVIIPRYVFESHRLVFDSFEDYIDQILQGPTWMTKDLSRHGGTDIVVPREYSQDLIPFVDSIRLGHDSIKEYTYIATYYYPVAVIVLIFLLVTNVLLAYVSILFEPLPLCVYAREYDTLSTPIVTFVQYAGRSCFGAFDALKVFYISSSAFLILITFHNVGSFASLLPYAVLLARV